MNIQSAEGIKQSDDAIAIIGMACRLPGGNDTPQEFWDFLNARRSGITEIPKDRWGVDVFYHENADSIAKSVSKWAGFVDDARKFDAQFFGISPREAAAMDPQQRLLLQATYDAMQDAKLPAERFSEQKTGVFVGISQSDYRIVQEMRLTNSENYAGTGYALCINANRISHRFNLHGPSYAVDTACSSSMVALDQAVRSIQDDACEMAVVAGVNILGHPSSFLAFSKAGMLSDTGQISTFDERANGFVRGEGVGVVIIKRLSRAQADGDRIHAVVHATEVNQDGYTSTMTAPNQAAQIDMLEKLFERTSIRRDQIGFVEAHGTGTPIGDPIEAGAIGRVIGQHNPDRPVWVGSGKANIGHLESGAGIAGLIKATLAVKHGVVPPNVNFKSPNPNIPFDALNLRVPTRPEPFPDADGTRYAVINSFGFGGTNASALISSAPERGDAPVSVKAEPGTDFPLFFPVTGASPEGLAANAAELIRALRGKGALAETPLTAVSRALATGRSHLAYRSVILARTKAELQKALKKLAANDVKAIEKADNIITGQVQPKGGLCFMFAGQGSQWWGMARDLLTRNAVFSRAVDAYDAEFVKAAGWSIKAELLKDEGSSRIDDTAVTQPALFAIQAGLAALWASFGIKPDMVVGHSIGEAAAAHVAGGLSLSGAARFLSKRGAIRDQLGAKGAMAAIGLGHEDVESFLPDHGLIGIAAINGPGSTTISGDFDAIHEFVEEFQALNPDTFIRILKVDTAWHSYQLEAGEDWFRQEVAQIDWKVPTTPFISTVSGKLESRFDTDYGWLNLRRPVMFQAGIEAALRLGATTFVELGPHSTLAGPATSTAMESGARVNVLQSISRKHSDFDSFPRAAAQLFVAGYNLDWATICGGRSPETELPGYAWQNEAFWNDSEESRDILGTAVRHPYLGMRSQGASTSWKSEINLKAYPYLRDHRLQNDTIFPAAGYIDTILAAAHELFGDKTFEIENAIIHDAMFIGPEQDILLSSVYDPVRQRMKLYSRQRDSREEWILRSEAALRVTDIDRPRPIRFDPAQKGLKRIDLAHIYDVDSKDSFINYGEAFQVVKDLWMTRSKTIARITYPESARTAFGQHFTHPTMLDGCLQITDPRMTIKRVHKGRKPGDPIYLPVGAGRIRYFSKLPDEIYVHARQIENPQSADSRGGFVVTDVEGNVLMTVDGLAMRALPTRETAVADDGPVPHFVTQNFTELRSNQDLTPASGKPGHWLVLGETGPVVKRLSDAIQAQGARVDVISRGDLKGGIVDALTARYGDALEAGKIAGIVFAWPLAMPTPSETDDAEALLAPIERNVKDMIAIGDMMDFYRTTPGGLARLVLLTTGAHVDPRTDTADPRVLGQAPMVAVGRALASETPEYTVRLIDADADALRDSATMARRILGTTAETEVILRGDQVFAPRLHQKEVSEFDSRALVVPAGDQSINFHATMRTPGVIDDLELNEIPLEDMSADQVRVRIVAVGLNFRDVMAVTGLLPAEAEKDPAWQHLGLEFGAEVVATGANVTSVKPGDRVMGLGRRCLQRFMTVDPRSLTILPEHISLEQAATIPSAFATAHYALNHMGRMRAGEKVLIHVATGGVGTAAVQLAQTVGAEIFATAGSPKKRKILKDLGIKHVMDSRSLQFADDVMRITDGKGVDVLLNSLPGDYIAKGLDIMAPYGRFLEIGKRDVYADSSIGMKALRRNVSVSVMDLAAMGNERPELLAEMFSELIERFQNRDLQPLPVTSFPVSKIADAFRYMSQARHVGKVVVTLDEDTFTVRRDPNRPVRLKGDASYLVTGGTRGFGLTIADWLSRAGAGELILASRTGSVDKADEKKIAAMQARGTKITQQGLDITDEAAVNALIGERATGNRPLRGVIHGAAVIKDGFANQLSDEMITDVLRPKIAGGWALHRAIVKHGLDLDFLLGFSSIAQVIGSGGQCNYVAANAFLDALAAYRQSTGLVGSAIDWGAIAESGFVARSENLANYLESVGLNGLTDSETELGMEVALSRDITAVTFSKADWAQMARANVAIGASPRFAALLQSEGGGNSEIRARLMQLEGEALRAEASELVQEEICNVLKIDKSSIQTDRPMSELGLDSLSSFELKMRVETALDFNLPVSKFLKAPSVDELSVILAEEIETARAAELAKGTDVDDSGATSKRADRDRVLPSDSQVGLVRDTLAKMTSNHARRAMEHVLTADLPEAPSQSKLAKSIAKLTRRHPMLGLNMTDGSPDTLGFGGTGPRQEDTIRGVPLAVRDGEFVRIGVESCRLELRMHHAVGDAASAAVVLAELLALLADEPLPRAVPKSAVFKALAASRYDADHAAGQNDRVFWWYSMAAGARPVPFSSRGRAATPLGLGRDHGPGAQISTALDHNMSEADIMVALAGALRTATQSQGPVLMARAGSLRAGLPAGTAVGPFETCQPVLVPANRKDRVARAVLNRALHGADSHTRFDCYAAAEVLKEQLEGWGVTPFQIGFAMRQNQATTNAEHALYDLFAEVVETGSGRQLVLTYDRDVMALATAEAVLKTLSAAQTAPVSQPDAVPV